MQSKFVLLSLTFVLASFSIVFNLSFHENYKAKKEFFASKNNNFVVICFDIAKNSNIVKKKVILLNKKDKPDHILGLIKFLDYIYSEPIKQS